MDKKLGPLKTWQWGALVAGLLLLYYLYKKNKESSTTQELAPSETFATGSTIGQGTEGTGSGIAGGGTPAEQPTSTNMTQAATAPTETATAPGLGAGQLFATELGEVNTAREALQASGLIPPAQSANPALQAHAEKEHNRIMAQAKRIKALERKTGGKAPGNHKARKKATHAKQGAHHHAVHHAKKPTPHHGATHAASAHRSGGTRAPAQHHGSSHHRRRR